MGVLKTVVFVSLPVLGICATVLYLLHKKEEEDLQDTLQDVKTSRIKTIEMKIPINSVGLLIGRGGSNIKELQQKTDTRICFNDRDNNEGDYRTCYVKGTAESAQMAEALIHEFITSQPPIEVHETWIPQKATGRIIGRHGENVRCITRASNAKVIIDSGFSRNDQDSGGQTRVVIKGTTEQIRVALSLIEEKVEEDAEVRRKMDLCQSSRSPRAKPKSTTASPIKTKENEKKSRISEALSAMGSDGFLQVFVSAVATPNRFWIQVFSPRSVELDHLNDEMSDYYSKEENRILHALKKAEIGQIVAAPYPNDDKWYRAEVKTIEANDCNENESQLDLYYVDYGDCNYFKTNDIYQLRTDFLKLPFQAIECTLANLKPNEGEEWSEKAIEMFEELSHVAQWRPLMAKVVSCDQKTRGQREGSPVPSVRLFDTSGTEDININEELVKHGYAVCDETSHNGSVGSPSHRSQSGASTPLLRNSDSPSQSGTSTPDLRNMASPEPGSNSSTSY